MKVIEASCPRVKDCKYEHPVCSRRYLDICVHKFKDIKMIKDYLGDCLVCGGSGCKIYQNCHNKHNCPCSLLEDNHCTPCHRTGKPVVVEYEEIKGVPEGYEFKEYFKNKVVFKECNFPNRSCFNCCFLNTCLLFSVKLPYNIGSIDEYICEDCYGKGVWCRYAISTCSNQDCTTCCRNGEMPTCIYCKGKGKIKRKVIAITVVQIDGKHSFEIKRVLV